MAYTLTTNKTWAQTEAELKTALGRWGAKEYVLTRGNQNTSAKAVRDRAASWNETPEQATVRLVVRWASGREMALEYNRQSRSVDNLRALYLCIENVRLNELRGLGDALREIYAQLPAGAATPIRRSPYDVLDVKPGSPIEVAEASYKVLAKLRHPDKPGGSDEKMAELNDAIERLRKGDITL